MRAHASSHQSVCPSHLLCSELTELEWRRHQAVCRDSDLRCLCLWSQSALGIEEPFLEWSRILNYSVTHAPSTLVLMGTARTSLLIIDSQTEFENGFMFFIKGSRLCHLLAFKLCSVLKHLLEFYHLTHNPRHRLRSVVKMEHWGTQRLNNLFGLSHPGLSDLEFKLHGFP